MTNQYVVVGNPIAHSRSPQIHQHFAKQLGISLTYTRQCLQPDTFNQQMQALFDSGVKGANVTMPFKHQAYQLATEHTKRATIAEAANTLYFDDGKLVADNTDGWGLVASIEQLQGYSLQGKRVAILGAGGAVRGVVQPLLAAGVSALTIANRTVIKAEQIVEAVDSIRGDAIVSACSLDALISGYDVVINATPTGLTQTALPINGEQLQGTELLVDMVYGAQSTPLMQLANEQGVSAIDGLGMLIGQAAESFYIWHRQRPDIAQAMASIGRTLR